MNTGLKAVIGLFAIIVIIVVGVVIGLSSQNEETPVGDESIPKADEIVKLVQNYNGKDGKGSTIAEFIGITIGVAYRGEDILSNPSTEFGWYTFEDLMKEDGVYEVGFNFKTYKEETEYIFYYDTNSKSIWAGNQGASDILKVVDTLE